MRPIMVLMLFAGFVGVLGQLESDEDILSEMDYLRSFAKEMFFHGFDKYMEFAWPADELKPLTCQPRWREATADRGDVDATLGMFQLTLVDSLDTIYIMDEKEKWRFYLKRMIETIHFDANVEVSVFETNIRILGGLLTNHLFCIEEGNMQEEANELLRMAIEVGDRLLPAFDTPTGLPLNRVNLKTGNTRESPTANCVACSGTFLLEFGLLSRLSGDSKYENAARKALEALKVAAHGKPVMGGEIDTQTGLWTQSFTGIGASIDSLYEYLLKSYIFFADQSLFDFFEDLYTRAMKHLYIQGWYLQSNMNTGQTTQTWTDSLGAFWPGMQVLVGDLQAAQTAFNRFWEIWEVNEVGLPERWDVLTNQPTLAYYNLRPELIESAYMLYNALGDPFYLKVAKRMMLAIDDHCRTPCGFASVADVATKRLDNTMDSFFLSETCKYLYLIFTPNHTINRGNYIFTTEAHPFKMNQSWQLKAATKGDQVQLRPLVCRPAQRCSSLWDTQPCNFTNSLFTAPPKMVIRKSLHFVLNGFSQHQVKDVGAQLLPSDREVIITLKTRDSKISSFYAIRGEMSGLVPQTTVMNQIAWASDLACTPESSDHLKGKIALVHRGGCTFVEKAVNLNASGAAGIIVIDNADTAIFTMSDHPNQPSLLPIPAVLISKQDGKSLADTLSIDVNATASLAYIHPHNPGGILQIVLHLRPGTSFPIPPLGYESGNKAFRFGENAVVLIADDPVDQAWVSEWEGSHFEVFVQSEAPPVQLRRKP